MGETPRDKKRSEPQRKRGSIEPDPREERRRQDDVPDEDADDLDEDDFETLSAEMGLLH